MNISIILKKNVEIEYNKIKFYLESIKKKLEKIGYLFEITCDSFILDIKKYLKKFNDTELNYIWTPDISKLFIKILKLINNKSKLKKYNSNYLNIFDENKCIYINDYTPQRLLLKKFKKKITKIGCGSKHTVILSEYSIYTFGENCTFGQLGHGKNFLSIKKPKLIDNNKKIINIIVGFSTTFMITDENCIYSCGAGENGRLGIDSYDNSFIFKKVILDENIIVNKIQIGSMHSCLLTKDYSIYSWGSKYYTGHNKKKDILKPLLLDRFNKQLIKNLSIGWGGYHTACVTYSGDIYVWGHNRVGQLGINPTKYKYSIKEDNNANYIPFPLKIKMFNGCVKNIMCGWGHTTLITVDNKIYSCGRNNENQLGISTEYCEKNYKKSGQIYFIDQFTYIRNLDKYNIKEIFVCTNCNYFITDNNNIYYFGGINNSKINKENNKITFLFNTNNYKVQINSKCLLFQ